MERMDEEDYAQLDDRAKNQKWLGNDPASLAEIDKTNKSIQISLPDSLKDFYLVSNGWRGFYPEMFTMYPLSKIQKFAVHNLDIIEAMESGFSVSNDVSKVLGEDESQEPFLVSAENLKQSIEIGKGEDDQYILLGRQNKGKAPESEQYVVWLFATWYPGVYKYHSVYELLEKLHKGLLISNPKVRES